QLRPEIRGVLMRRMVFVCAVGLSIVSLSFAGTSKVEKAERAPARRAVSQNSAESAAVIAALRARGYEGLEEFLEAFALELRNREREISADALQPATAEWQRISAALDQVCGQRDCYAS